LIIDRDTKGESGMPDIAQTVLSKISNSVIVVADLTIINPLTVRRTDERPVPNPNVLLELGYGLGKHGQQSIIGIFNTAYGQIEELPFDLRPRRLLHYFLETEDGKPTTKKHLVDSLASAIKQCLGETDAEKLKKNSTIHLLLCELWMLGTEVDGHRNFLNELDFPKLSKEIQGLPKLIEECGHSSDFSSWMAHISKDLEKIVTLEFNDENWQNIRLGLTDLANNAKALHDELGLRLSPEGREKEFQSIDKIILQINAQLINLQKGEFHKKEYEEITIKLRKIAFNNLAPQHPQLKSELEKLSLKFRMKLLEWKRSTPTGNEIKGISMEISDNLSALVSKYNVISNN
jgi:hypothetical protein